MLKSSPYWHSVTTWQLPPDKAMRKRVIGEACLTLRGRLRSAGTH